MVKYFLLSVIFKIVISNWYIKVNKILLPLFLKICLNVSFCLQIFIFYVYVVLYMKQKLFFLNGFVHFMILTFKLNFELIDKIILDLLLTDFIVDKKNSSLISLSLMIIIILF